MTRSQVRFLVRPLGNEAQRACPVHCEQSEQLCGVTDNDEVGGSIPPAPTRIKNFMERAEAGPEKKERQLYKFTYRDNSAGGKIIFECIAEKILDADKLYEAKTGKNPEKQNYVGCSVEKIKES